VVARLYSGIAVFLPFDRQTFAPFAPIAARLVPVRRRSGDVQAHSMPRVIAKQAERRKDIARLADLASVPREKYAKNLATAARGSPVDSGVCGDRSAFTAIFLRWNDDR
jgi:hypothetical protein